MKRKLTRDEIITELRTLLARECGISHADEITLENSFPFLGIDSLDIVAIGTAITEAFDIRVTDEDEAQWSTFGCLVRFVEKHQEAA